MYPECQHIHHEKPVQWHERHSIVELLHNPAAFARGAQRVHAEARRVILIEVFDDSRDEVTKTLFQDSYKLYDGDAKPRVRVEEACFNTLAVPSGR